MKPRSDLPKPDAATCSDTVEEALTLYLDGELPYAEQPLLFAHLATCDRCRRILGAMMEFRRMSRQEVFHVPPAIDEAFYKRLKEVKSRSKRVDRYMDRRPLWQWHLRAPVSLRVAAMAALLIFVAGLMLPQDAGLPLASEGVVAVEERVEWNTVPYSPPLNVLVWPGLTVESTRIVEQTTIEAY